LELCSVLYLAPDLKSALCNNSCLNCYEFLEETLLFHKNNPYDLMKKIKIHYLIGVEALQGSTKLLIFFPCISLLRWGRGDENPSSDSPRG